MRIASIIKNLSVENSLKKVLKRQIDLIYCSYDELG
jgi:hypothetical protein